MKPTGSSSVNNVNNNLGGGAGTTASNAANGGGNHIGMTNNSITSVKSSASSAYAGSNGGGVSGVGSVNSSAATVATASTSTATATATSGNAGAGTAPRRGGGGVPTIGVPTSIDYGRYRFLITDCPDDRTMGTYIDMMRENHVVHIGRACEPSYYSCTPLSTAGIQVHEFMFEDGSPPPAPVLRKWLDLVEGCFVNRKSPDFLIDNQRVGVHCVAGLGRAPVLVAVALIEAGMSPLEAAQFVRARRKGALNTVQLHWLETYVKQRRWNAIGDGGNEGTVSGGVGRLLYALLTRRRRPLSNPRRR